jgi:carboxypeptidase C (cathepsin A)
MRTDWVVRLAAVAAFSLLGSSAIAQEETPPSPSGRASAQPGVPVRADRTSVTKHTVTVDGTPIAYTATAGTLLIRDDNDAPIGSFFYVAYTKDDTNKSTRPITFAYNGGPGSSSVWLHMASIGPKRVVTPDAQTAMPGAYQLADNASTLLDKTDIVFVDAMATGFSRIVGRGRPNQFFGIDEDAGAFAKFIRRYLTVDDRWLSPKFLFGESYGTTRSAALADVLQDQGVYLNGVTLLSTVLDFNTLSPSAGGEDLSYIGFLPTEAATAWYHNRIPNKPASLAAFVQSARDFAAGPYASALMRDSSLSDAERTAIANRLHGFIGLDARYILQSNLRVTPGRFEKELLRAQGRTVGRLDSRYTGFDADNAGERTEYDAADTATAGPFTAAFNHYIRDELKWTGDGEYLVTNYGVVNRAWNFQRSGRGRSQANVAGDLREAMSKNPHLRVFSANGYYDLATPFFATQYTLSHLGLDPSLRAHIKYGFYESGHMVYLNNAALVAFKTDLSSFYNDATPH